MTILADSPVSWVALDLDTTAPSIEVTTQDRVEPPDGLAIRVEASEDIGVTRVTLTDAAGVEHRIGSVLVDARTLVAVLPTVEIASGPATLDLVIRDTACNPATATLRIEVARPRRYDVLAWSESAYEVTKTMTTPHEVSTDSWPEHTVTVTHSAEFDTESDHESEFDVEASHAPA